MGTRHCLVVAMELGICRNLLVVSIPFIFKTVSSFSDGTRNMSQHSCSKYNFYFRRCCLAVAIELGICGNILIVSIIFIFKTVV